MPLSSDPPLLLRSVLCAVQGTPAPGLAYEPGAARGWGAFVPDKGGGGAAAPGAPHPPPPPPPRPARLLARRLAEAGWLHRAVRAEAERPAVRGEGDAVRAARAALRAELAPLADALAALEAAGRGRGGGGRAGAGSAGPVGGNRRCGVRHGLARPLRRPPARSTMGP